MHYCHPSDQNRIRNLEEKIEELERQHNRLVSFLEGYFGAPGKNIIMNLSEYKINE